MPPRIDTQICFHPGETGTDATRHLKRPFQAMSPLKWGTQEKSWHDLRISRVGIE